MLLALKLFFGGLLKRILALFGWLMDHPIVLVGVLALGIGFFGGCTYKTDWAETQVQNMKDKIAANEQKAKDEAAKIRSDSAAAAERLAKENGELQANLDALVDQYVADLDKARAEQKIKVVKVPVPGKAAPVEVMFEGDKQVCRSYTSTYKDTVNNMVKKAEESLGLKK